MTDIALPRRRPAYMARLFEAYGQEIVVLAAILVLFIVVGLYNPRFLSNTNLTSIYRTSKAVNYHDKHVLDSWWELAGLYADNSDGHVHELFIGSSGRWADNDLTALAGGATPRLTTTLTSHRLGLTATLDLAEIEGQSAVPIEYRKGRARRLSLSDDDGDANIEPWPTDRIRNARHRVRAATPRQTSANRHAARVGAHRSGWGYPTKNRRNGCATAHPGFGHTAEEIRPQNPKAAKTVCARSAKRIRPCETMRKGRTKRFSILMATPRSLLDRY